MFIYWSIYNRGISPRHIFIPTASPRGGALLWGILPWPRAQPLEDPQNAGGAKRLNKWVPR